jgi:hypothetical protein
MRKMKLNLEDVSVESFVVGPEGRGRGSIWGQESYLPADEEIDGGGTRVSCEGTCGKTCYPCNTADNTCSCLASCPCDFEQVFGPPVENL